jgi:glycosyltransferase involved in cell wall biosynthesis
MRVDLISSRTYRAVLPWDNDNSSGYGSEVMAAILMDALADRNPDWEFHWYAPAGSTNFDNKDNVTFHPLNLDFGNASQHELLDECSIEGLTYKFLADSDFVIDHSATARNVEELKWYESFLKYVCYRNGYVAFNRPRLLPKECHFITPSKANAEIFKQHGYDSIPIYYGIPGTFYYQGGKTDEQYWSYFQNQGITEKEYFLFFHRPTKDKGIDKLIRLAKDLPNIKFVVAGNAQIQEHYDSLLTAKREKVYNNIDNLIFVDLPLNSYHSLYIREICRNAKAMLSPFDYPNYLEGFGITNAISVALGVPLIITDSPSTRELWIEGKDALYVDGYYSLKYAVEYFDSMSTKLAPSNKFRVDDYARNYEDMAMLYNTPESIN